MQENRLLTVDPKATKAKLLADGRTVAPYADARGINRSTLARILNGTYPVQDGLDSAYQQALRVLAKDGYLVEAGQQDQAA